MSDVNPAFRPGWRRGLGAALILLLAAGGAAVLMAGDRARTTFPPSPVSLSEQAGPTCPTGPLPVPSKENTLMDSTGREAALHTPAPPLDTGATKETETATFALG